MELEKVHRYPSILIGMLSMNQLSNLIAEFVETIRSGQTEIYNEFSLQHELGIFLRQKIPASKVQFELNVTHFSLQQKPEQSVRDGAREPWTWKKEVDMPFSYHETNPSGRLRSIAVL
jgi:hypothetical protein